MWMNDLDKGRKYIHERKTNNGGLKGEDEEEDEPGQVWKCDVVQEWENIAKIEEEKRKKQHMFVVFEWNGVCNV